LIKLKKNVQIYVHFQKERSTIMKKLLMPCVLLLMILMVHSNVYAQTGQDVTYEVNNQAYEGYFVSAKDGAPMVLVIHDWDGLTDYEKKRAHMLADLGYSVFAADLFGAGIRPAAVAEKRQRTGALYEDREKMRALLFGALAAAKAQGADTANAVAMGYCFGGAAVLELARSGADLKGFAAFHGGLTTPQGQDYSKTKGEVIIFHGTADSSVSMDDFASLAKELEEAKVDHEMITYSQALHAFTVFDSKDRYNKKADLKSWKRFVGFLNERLMK
jgi:dienelactone hydrolase